MKNTPAMRASNQNMRNKFNTVDHGYQLTLTCFDQVRQFAQEGVDYQQMMVDE